MTKVMVFGAFDLYHKGHEEYFKQGKKLGAFLTVIVARDLTIRRLKKQEPKYSESERMSKVLESKYVDEVLLGHKKDLFKIVAEEKPGIVLLGYDQQVKEEWVEEKLKKKGLKNFKVMRAAPYKAEIYKSSLLKKKKRKPKDNLKARAAKHLSNIKFI